MKFVFYISAFLLFLDCGNTKTYTAQEQNTYENLRILVASKNFEIIAHTAKPMMSNALTQVLNSNLLPPRNTPAHIIIIGTSNSLRFEGDTIHGSLPFYGEQFSGGNPASNNQGISFNDVPEDYTVIMNDTKHSVNISFKIKDEHRSNERYEIYITLFSNNTFEMSVQSNTSRNIQFTGNVKALETEKHKAIEER